MSERLLSRSEVDQHLTWDLSLIFHTEEDYHAAVEEMKALSEKIYSRYPGKLNTPDMIDACLQDYHRLTELMTHTGTYTELAVEVDYYDNENRDRASRNGILLAEIRSKMSFIDSELSQQDDEILKAAAEKSKCSEGYIRELLRRKPHLLHPEAERVLAATERVGQAPYEIYNTIKLADMTFENFEVNGKSYPLGYSLFEDNYEYEQDTDVRRAAFDAFSAKLKAYENSTAAAFNAHLQHNRAIAMVRGYQSLTDKDLFRDSVTEDLYNRQIDLITKKLAPHMRRFAKLIQWVNGLEKMTYADLKLPLDPGYSPSVTLTDAKDYVVNGLSIMGDAYREMIETGLRERWVDFAQNQGKCTGGFCASPYGKPSFILMSWHNKMSDVFTLAHEFGHAGHFALCNEAQSIFDTEVSGYFVEAPSTMNELLMAHYLLKTSDDKRFRRWVLSNIVGNTYYHNCVTHLLEGAYQREVYSIIDNGGSVQAEVLSEIMDKVLRDFWGDAVEMTPGAELTWMRQPHYYMGLYSYTYSAGLTIATQMCKRVEEEGEKAVEDWKKVLRAGSTLTPVELAKLGGIDISTDAPLLDTIEIIGGYIDEMYRLTEEIEAENA